MNILIYSITYDVHVAAVTLALADQGHAVQIIHGSDYPTRSCMSACIDTGHDLRLLHELGQARSVLSDADTVWNRRYVTHELPDDAVHAADHAFASREARSFADGARVALAQRGFWVNSPAAQACARHKLAQLRVARECGLRIPATLISNNKSDVLAFCRRQGGRTIYKPHMPATWLASDNSGNMACLYTAVCNEADLNELPESAFQLSPGIYQGYVEKHYEVRATFFGEEELSLRLESQQQEISRIDWRRGQRGDMQYQPHRLPDAIYQACLQLMRRFGIVSGCFDFIVDSDGEYVFLEVNEGGQFLWVEQRCAEIPMLDTFCDFLVCRDPAYRRKHDSPRLSFAEAYRDPRLKTWLDDNVAAHVPATVWHVSAE
ncbi:glutathione synthase/RimK-type ligase-like ATP-grasp enzyme [Tahibacter aquaticus]|uniref:Glutathione synthase/RimK-type ligase-like ATP-grasp enzyme n=1 Tax=Tahibacter aquaticus TaxID=520092 RepID=A0A4R6YRP2_9GAMM|nr:hypothetical protein [Tahibacter aquaticus]TDR40756.1 glutathione synthase/RimK-type ligase-like ATP-grasp enzyme [Tahibacter aquaticus]